MVQILIEVNRIRIEMVQILIEVNQIRFEMVWIRIDMIRKRIDVFRNRIEMIRNGIEISFNFDLDPRYGRHWAGENTTRQHEGLDWSVRPARYIPYSNSFLYILFLSFYLSPAVSVEEPEPPGFFGRSQTFESVVVCVSARNLFVLYGSGWSLFLYPAWTNNFFTTADFFV